MIEKLSGFLSQWRWLIGIPLAVACVVAAVDTIQNYLPLPAAFHSFDDAILPAIFGAARFLALYLIFAPFLVLAPYLVWRTDPMLSSLALGLVAGYLSQEFEDPLTFGSTLRNLLPFTIAGLCIMALGKGVRSFVPHILRSLVLLSVGLWLYYWILYFGWRDLFRAAPWAGVVALAVIASPTLVLVAVSRLSPAPRAVIALCVVAFILPFAWIPYSSNYRVLRSKIAPSFAGEIRHVILITIDTLRADALHYMNADAPDTPHFDEFAAESVVFVNAVSPAPWTFPSMESLMTGVAPYIDSSDLTYPTAPLPTLAARLGEAGYLTRGISGNHILYRPLNVTAGFQEMDTYANTPFGLSKGASAVEARLPGCSICGGATRELTDVALEWVQRVKDQPFFLWVHYFDPHDPYAPPPEYLSDPSTLNGLRPTGTPIWTKRQQADVKRLYEIEVRYVDENLGRLFSGLKQSGLYDDALIIVTSDHGEEFWERGKLGHRWTLHREVLHVPLLVRLPGGVVRRRNISYVPTQALMPTVLELCGVPAPEALGRARPFTHLLHPDGEDSYKYPIISSGVRHAEPQRAVVVAGFKYISRLDSGREELYNLESDPWEAHSVVEEFPAIVERAREILAEHEEISGTLRGMIGDSAEHDPEKALRRLRALGYIQ